MKCPYDPSHDNSTKPTLKGFRYYAKCAVCDRTALAVIYPVKDSIPSYRLVRIGAVGSGEENRKKVRTFRASDGEMQAVADGKKRLVVDSKFRITVTV